MTPADHTLSTQSHEPSYLRLHRTGVLRERAETALASLAHCELCPHACGADRLAGKQGVCRSGPDPVIASWTTHPWEEPPISGARGSGTIFFSGCTGRCRFCQNYPISQLGYGNRVSIERFATMMLQLERRGVHNINFVTPTHFVPQILAAVDLAAADGLRIPLVYNTSGYESVATLRLLEDVVDLWLPDAKYADDGVARRLSGFPGYVEANRAALLEIHRQVGDALVLDDDGTALRGLIVRHLVLPGGLSGTDRVMAWLASALSPDVHVSVMNQYFPAHKAVEDALLGRKATAEEYDAALAAFEAAGLQHGWMQEHDVCDAQLD